MAAFSPIAGAEGDAVDQSAEFVSTVISDTDWSQTQAECEPVRAQAVAAAEAALGIVKDAAVDLVRSHCADKAKEDCEAPCTYCKSNSTSGTCWPYVDTANPCLSLAVKFATLGGQAGSAVAGAIADAGMEAMSACGDHTTHDECVGDSATVAGSLFCQWCEQTRKCHTMGSLANTCLRAELADMAKEHAVNVGTEAWEAAKDKYTSVIDGCQAHDGDAGNCSAQVQCTWCGGDHNKCYFIGDTSNKCFQEVIGPYVDTASGLIADVKDRAIEGYESVKAWGENLCGQHKEKTACDNAAQCSYCDTDSLCYVWGSVSNPCGFFQGAIGTIEDAWNSLFGSDPACAADVQAAGDTLVIAVQMATDNVAALCKAYTTSEVYSTRSLAALQSDLGNATDFAAETASMHLATASRNAHDAVDAVKELKNETKLLEALKEANPCLEVSFALRLALGAFPVLLVALALP